MVVTEMIDIQRRALLGDKQAQEECTRRGIVLACPCCGGKATIGKDCDGDCYQWWGSIYCENCGLELNGVATVDEKQAVVTEEMIGEWNTRPAPPIGRCKDCANRHSSEFCECRPGDAFCSEFEPKEEADNE